MGFNHTMLQFRRGFIIKTSKKKKKKSVPSADQDSQHVLSARSHPRLGDDTTFLPT